MRECEYEKKMLPLIWFFYCSSTQNDDDRNKAEKNSGFENDLAAILFVVQ